MIEQIPRNSIRILQVSCILFFVSLLTACGGAANSSSDLSAPSSTSSKSVESSSSSSNTTSSSSSKSSTSKSSKSSQTSSSQSSRFIDNTPPSPPESLSVVEAQTDRVALEWLPAADDIGIVAYRVYRNQVEIASTSGAENNFIDFNVSSNKTYSYAITASDQAGNWSPLKVVSAQTPSIQVQSSSAASSNSVSSGASSSAVSMSSTSNSSTSSSRSSSSRSSTNSSRSSSSLSSASSSNISAHAVNGNVTLQWAAPTLRQDGSRLYAAELGGYEIRYATTPFTTYTTISITDNSATSYTIPNLTGNYIFEIASFDTNRLYSTYTSLSPH